MSIWDILKKSLGNKEKNATSLLTEEDILKAIDELETPAEEHQQDTTMVGYSQDELTERVPAVGAWSEFKYVSKPMYEGINDVGEEKIYFTIPCGFEWEGVSKIKMWYMYFPLNGKTEDVTEFFTYYDAGSVGVGTEE